MALSFRPTETDEHFIEVITEYLATNRPDLPSPKKSQAIRYALYIAANSIKSEYAKQKHDKMKLEIIADKAKKAAQ